MIDLRIFNSEGQLEFNPASPFCIGRDVKVQQFRLELYRLLLDVMRKGLELDEKKRAIQEVMSEVSYYGRQKIEGFEGSMLTSAKVDGAHIALEIDLKIDGVNERVIYE